MASKAKLENEKRRDIIDWAKEHNFVIDPSGGMEICVKNILEFGYCPCDPNRLNCPCPESVTEVQQNGHCLCRLYWKDLDTFKSILKAGKKDEESTSRQNTQTG